jgi:hypothetical protein
VGIEPAAAYVALRDQRVAVRTVGEVETELMLGALETVGIQRESEDEACVTGWSATAPPSGSSQRRSASPRSPRCPTVHEHARRGESFRIRTIVDVELQPYIRDQCVEHRVGHRPAAAELREPRPHRARSGLRLGLFACVGQSFRAAPSGVDPGGEVDAWGIRQVALEEKRGPGVLRKKTCDALDLFSIASTDQNVGNGVGRRGHGQEHRCRVRWSGW